jgi:hypothetical protein
MDVLIMSTSSGSGGGMLCDGKKDSCVGFTKESIQDYVNPFPNLPIRIPENSKYQQSRAHGSMSHIRIPFCTTAVSWRLTCCPKKETDHLIDLFEYFQAVKLCHCNSRLVNLESLEQERAWYEKQRETAYQHEQDRKQREKLKRVSNIILPLILSFSFTSVIAR